MSKEYILKPNKKFSEIKDSKRKAVEKTLGRELTDKEWIKYKQMTLKRQKDF